MVTLVDHYIDTELQYPVFNIGWKQNRHTGDLVEYTVLLSAKFMPAQCMT